MTPLLSRPSSSDSASWLLIASMLFIFLLLQRVDPFSLMRGTALLPLAGLAALAASAIGCRVMGLPRATAAAVAFLQMTTFTLLGILLSYGIAAHAGELWDDRLAAWDRSLGLDWTAIAKSLDAEPVLAVLTGVAYHSLIPQMIVAIVALSAAAEIRILRTMVCAAILSGFATILLSGVFPARGNLFNPDDYDALWPSIAWLHADIIDNLRNGSLRALDLGAMMGIVTFPSYHAALATIFIWAFRHVRGLGVIGGIWAASTIAATPIGGGHYLVDVLAGLALGVASIPMGRRLTQMRPVGLPMLPGKPYPNGRAPSF